MADDQVVARVSEPAQGVVCSFGGSAFDALTPRERRDYDVVKAAVLADGGFSVFDASSTRAMARIFDALGSDHEIVKDSGSVFPWVRVSQAPPKVVEFKGRVHD